MKPSWRGNHRRQGLSYALFAAAAAAWTLNSSGLLFAIGLTEARQQPSPLAGDLGADRLQKLPRPVLQPTLAPATGAGASLGSILLAGVGCAIAAATAGVRAAGSRSSSRAVVARQGTKGGAAIPHMKRGNRDIALRRFEPFGILPGFSSTGARKKKIDQSWRKLPQKRLSDWGLRLYEKQRVRWNYDIQATQLSHYVSEGLAKGVQNIPEKIMGILESRIDHVIFRLGWAKDVPQARWLIHTLSIDWKGAHCDDFVCEPNPWRRLCPGDMIRVRKRKFDWDKVTYWMSRTGPVPIPPHLELDKKNMVGRYLDVCDPKDISMNVKASYLLQWFCGQGQALQTTAKRDYTVFYPGTDLPVPKRAKSKAHIRPCPEHLYNMRRGHGLLQRGHKRPPSMWGRKPGIHTQLNDPYLGDTSRQYQSFNGYEL